MLLAMLFLSVGGSYILFSRLSDDKRLNDKKITELQKQISALTAELSKLSGKNIASILPVDEIAKREAVRENSQESQLTAAVAKVAPSVVSIVISKNVPQLEIVYRNPFGDDPFFKDSDFLVPQFRQKGVEKKKVGAGSGFLLSPDGYILTNKHVVSDEKAEYTVLLSNGTQKPARVIYKHPSNDVAIVKIDGHGYRAVNLGSSAGLKLGQSVVAIGNALGEYDNSVSVGIISGLNRNIEASTGSSVETLKGVIQTDAAINPGNSGGPLIDLDGRVVGVSVATIVGSNDISFALPIDAVKSVIRGVVR